MDSTENNPVSVDQQEKNFQENISQAESEHSGFPPTSVASSYNVLPEESEHIQRSGADHMFPDIKIKDLGQASIDAGIFLNGGAIAQGDASTVKGLKDQMMEKKTGHLVQTVDPKNGGK